MSKILFVDKVPLTIFYQRRIARILPSVAVFLAVVALAYLATGREISAYELLSAATFTNNYFVTSGRWTMPVGHIWSLSVEEHAYILLSLVALWCRARKTSGQAALGTIAAAAAATAAVYWFAFGSGRVPGLWLHTEVAGFGIMASAAPAGHLVVFALPVAAALLHVDAPRGPAGAAGAGVRAGRGDRGVSSH
jgi:peptidoglycan/LPS O-acetylase OafA/YrhL